MATNRNIVDMVEAIRKGSGGTTVPGGIDGIYIATVSSVEPLTIHMHNSFITRNIYVNTAIILEASNDEEKMKKVFQNPFDPPAAYQFLKEFHERFVLKKGDTVVVCMADNSFYIIGKAVQA